MDNLTKIKEDILEVQQNQNLVKCLYPENEEFSVDEYKDEYKFAYLAYIDSDKKLPVLGLFSEDITWLQDWLGFKKELEAFLMLVSKPAFTDLLLFLDVYYNHKTRGICISKIYESPPFKNNSMLDDILKDSRGYIVWHYQLEGLIRIFSIIPARVRAIRKDLNLRRPGIRQLIQTFQFADGSTLLDVYNERRIASTTSEPQYQGAYNLFNLITGRAKI